MRYSIVSFATLLALTPAALGHTWVEQLRVIDSTGSFTGSIQPIYPKESLATQGSEGAGYSRSNFPRELMIYPKSNEDAINRIQSLDPNLPLCRPEQRKVGALTAGFPALKASPGDMVALRYAENGHTTKLEPGRPDKGGTVYIYGTTQPKDNEKLMDIFKVWTADGKGGDGRGRLLATRNFDDGVCFESGGTDRPLNKQRFDAFQATGKMNETSEMSQLIGAGLWCQNDFIIPADWKAEGSIAVYWIWDWQLTTPNPPVEMYSTCMDIDLVPGTGTSKNLKFSQIDPNLAARETQLTNLFDVSIPSMGAVNGSVSLPALASDSANIREGASKSSSTPLPQDTAAATQVTPVSQGTAAATEAAPSASAPSSELSETQQKSTSASQAPAQSSAKANGAATLEPGQETFVPGLNQPPVTVTVTKDGPTSFMTVYRTIAIPNSYFSREESSTPATSGAGSKTASTTAVASSVAQVSSQAGASTGRPQVTGFMNTASLVVAATPASNPTPASASSTFVSTATSATDLAGAKSTVASSSTASPPVAATTEAPTAPQQTSVELQIITEDATVTEYQTLVQDGTAATTTSVASPLPTLSETQAFSNGTFPSLLPRMRRVRRSM